MSNSTTIPAGHLTAVIRTCESLIRSGDCPAVGVVNDVQLAMRDAHDARTPEQTARLVEDAITEYLTQTTSTERHSTLTELTTDLEQLCDTRPALANYKDSL